jgi:4-amino-4-deoxy-L-arabinose transferase-like glycosyltransferase
MLDPRDPKTVRRLSGIAFLFALVILFNGLGSLPLVSPDEGRNAEVAREMAASGSWLVPTYDGVAYLDKPFLYFGAVALSLRAFGLNEWAARLPSALAALAILIGLFRFLRRENALAAALAVLVVAGGPLFLAFARTVIFDMPLALCVLISMGAAFLAEREGARRRLLWAVAAAAAAVATLLKGPVGFLVPALAVVTHGLLFPPPSRRRLRIVGTLLAPLNLAVFFAITLPWFFGLVHARPDFLQYGLVEETVRRYTTTAFHRDAPFYYYAPVLLATFFPWSLLLFEAIPAAWRARRRWTPIDRLLVVGAIVVFVFFSTSRSKLPGYVLAGEILLGALVARLFAAALLDRAGKAARIVRRGGLILAFFCLACGLVLLEDLRRPEWVLATFRIHRAEFNRFQPAVVPLMVTFLGMAALGLAAWRARRPALTLAVFAAFPLSLVTVNLGTLRDYAEVASSRPVAQFVAGPETVATLEYFPTGLPFYLRRSVVLISTDGREMTSNYLLFMLREGQARPEVLVPYDEREAWLDASRGPVWLLAGRRGRPELERLAAARGAIVREIRRNEWGALLPAPPPR